MYTQLVIDLTAGTSTAINSAELVAEANVSDSFNPFNSYGTNSSFQGFFLMSYRDAAPVTTLDGSFKCFDSSGYSGAVAPLTGNLRHVMYRIKFVSNPEGLTIVLDKVGAPKVTELSVYNLDSSGQITEVHNLTVNPDDYSIVLLSDVVTAANIILEFRTEKGSLNDYVKILYIFPGVTGIYRGADIIKYECSEHLLDAQLSFTPGICEQYINATLYDRDDVLQRLAAQNKLATNKSIKVYAVDDDFRRPIGEYYSVDWDIRNCESEVGLTGSDGFSYLNNLEYKPYGISNKTVHQMLSDAFSYSNVSWRYLSDYEQLLCNAIITPSCEYPNTDIISLLEEICRVAMLRIYYYNGTFVVAAAVTP